jgi:3-hydroxybutyryl-CoA dehydrogenase
LEALVALLEKTDVVVTRELDDPRGGYLEIDGKVVVALTDGRSATERMAAESSLPLVLVDLALDYAGASRVALASADQAPAQALDTAAGLFQALGKAVSPLSDIPGLLVMRTVCMLVNEGADAVNQGVCAPVGVDTAMCKGLNFPRGPFEWAASLGLDSVLTVLQNLRNSYGEDRYRVSPWLRRKAFSGGVVI